MILYLLKWHSSLKSLGIASKLCLYSRGVGNPYYNHCHGNKFKTTTFPIKMFTANVIKDGDFTKTVYGLVKKKINKINILNNFNIILDKR